MESGNEHLLLSQDGYVATLTLNRPEKHNVWNPQMGIDMERTMRALGKDDSVRVIVITGAGKAFCGGADMEHLKAAREQGKNPMAPREHSDDDLNQRYSYLMAIPKPIICAINGAAIGIGLVLPLFCDFRYAAASAKLSVMFSRRGLVAEHGITWMLPRLIGLTRALELMIAGQTIKADEAERIGLVNATFSDETFREEVAKRAYDLANNVSPRSAAIIKRMTYAACASSLAQAVHAVDDEIPGVLASEDFREGVAHFMEKRPAKFTGH